MVASVSNSSSSISNWADSIYSKLDTRNQGYIEKTDLQDALAKVSGNGNGGQPVDVDSTFSALDGDSDGKITKSELTDAMTKLSDQLNAQFDASRAGRGGPHGAHGPHGGGHAGGDGDGDGGSSSSSSTDAASGTSGTSSASTASTASTDYIAAADTDGDGTVSDAEQSAYEKKAASSQATHQKDPMRELAHALHLLKAYAENSGGSDASATDASAGSTTSVSVEA
jgi:hypothetical protein